MQVREFNGNVISTPSDCLIVGIHDEWAGSDIVGQIDSASNGWFKKLLSTEEISTKALKTSSLIAPPGLTCKQLITVGLSSKDLQNATIASRAAASASKLAAAKPREIVRYAGFNGSPIEQRAAVSASIVGCVGQDTFRKEKSLFPPDIIEWHGINPAEVQAGWKIGLGINLTRRLVNLPANYLYPETLANEALMLAQEFGLDIEIWDRNRLEQERCGALLAVARGSTHNPRLVVLKYRGRDDNEQPVALVGKGVTFDSGGYSIKPTDGMLTMKCDMAGAATVLGVLRVVAQLRPPINVVAVVGLVENMISGDAFRLGDVLTARNGTTIEIHNTDAEGRLVLADCLNVALDHNPSKIVDFATLTGACVVALGNDISGLMTNNSAWQSNIQTKADACGEFTWPLPMHSFFKEQICGKVADIKNVGEGRWGGAITAAKFLEEFVDSRVWTHVDIAGPAFLENAKPWCDGGGTGTLVRTFAELLCQERLSQ